MAAPGQFQRLDLASTVDGQVFLGDLEISALGERDLTVVRRDRIGFVFQDSLLFPHLDVRGNLHYAMRHGRAGARSMSAASREAVIDMRRTMAEGHPNKTDLFDLKHDRGGMVDIEFIVQYLVLAHAHRHRILTRNDGNIALLGYAAKLGLIDAALAARVQEAYRVFRRRQHALRLAGARYARVAPDEVAAEARDTLALWQAVLPE